MNALDTEDPLASPLVDASEPVGELLLTRRDLARRLARAAVAGGAAYVARPAVRELLLQVGYGGTGHGLIPAITRRLLRYWK